MWMAAEGNVNDKSQEKSQRDYALMACSASFPFYGGSASGLRMCLASVAVGECIAIDVFERGHH
jgi:hypothetical protein